MKLKTAKLPHITVILKYGIVYGLDYSSIMSCICQSSIVSLHFIPNCQAFLVFGQFFIVFDELMYKEFCLRDK